MSVPLSTVAPVVGQAPMPASVRDGSPAARKAYETALDFEKMLVGQLTQSLVQGSGLGGEGETLGEESGEGGASEQAGAGLLSALAPQALTESLTRQGGLGLAAQLTGALDPAAASAAQQSSYAATAGGSAPSVASPSVPASAPRTGADVQPASAAGATGGVSA